MIWDVIVVLIFLISFLIGWTVRIYLNWVRVILVMGFAGILFFLIPYFVTFVEHSSAGWPSYVYYVFGLFIFLLIFLAFYIILSGNGSSITTVRRGAGSTVLAVVSTYALIIVLTSFSEYGWIDVRNSAIMTNLPSWLLYPVN